jgi:hypothetical protein
MSNTIRTWFARGAVLAAALAVNVARAEEPGVATWVVQQDVILESAPADGVEQAEASKTDAAKAGVVVDENGVIHSQYVPADEGQGEQKQK